MSDLHKFPLPLEKFKTIQIAQKYLQNILNKVFLPLTHSKHLPTKVRHSKEKLLEYVT